MPPTKALPPEKGVSGQADADRPLGVLLTVEEAARRLGIGRTLTYRLISSGELESVTVGRLRRVPAECLARYVAGLRSPRGSRAVNGHNAA